MCWYCSKKSCYAKFNKVFAFNNYLQEQLFLIVASWIDNTVRLILIMHNPILLILKSLSKYSQLLYHFSTNRLDTNQLKDDWNELNSLRRYVSDIFCYESICVLTLGWIDDMKIDICFELFIHKYYEKVSHNLCKIDE